MLVTSTCHLAIVVFMILTTAGRLDAQSASGLRLVTRVGAFLPLSSFRTESISDAQLTPTVAVAVLVEQQSAPRFGFRGGIDLAPGTRADVRVVDDVCHGPFGSPSGDCTTEGRLGVVAHLFAGVAYRWNILSASGGGGIRLHHAESTKCPLDDGVCISSGEFRTASYLPSGNISIGIGSRVGRRVLRLEGTNYVTRHLDTWQHEFSVGAALAW